MDILVLGGTRFFGVPMVEALLAAGHKVTLGTRGNTDGVFGARVSYIRLDRHDGASMAAALDGKRFDLVIDKLAYCSDDVKYLLRLPVCRRYIQMSSVSVYPVLGPDTKEEDFDPKAYPLRWCGHLDADYNEVKRQAECAAAQAFPEIPAAFVRYPVVLGETDHTGRLYFYVEHILHRKPMFVDNPDNKMAFISCEEGGRFLAHLAETNFTGPVNGAAPDPVSLAEIFAYVEAKTGLAPILHPEGDPGPYNGGEAFGVNTEKARALGFGFTPCARWLPPLLDACIARAKAAQAKSARA